MVMVMKPLVGSRGGRVGLYVYLGIPTRSAEFLTLSLKGQHQVLPASKAHMRGNWTHLPALLQYTFPKILTAFRTVFNCISDDFMYRLLRGIQFPEELEELHTRFEWVERHRELRLALDCAERRPGVQGTVKLRCGASTEMKCNSCCVLTFSVEVLTALTRDKGR